MSAQVDTSDVVLLCSAFVDAMAARESGLIIGPSVDLSEWADVVDRALTTDRLRVTNSARVLRSVA